MSGALEVVGEDVRQLPQAVRELKGTIRDHAAEVWRAAQTLERSLREWMRWFADVEKLDKAPTTEFDDIRSSVINSVEALRLNVNAEHRRTLEDQVRWLPNRRQSEERIETLDGIIVSRSRWYEDGGGVDGEVPRPSFLFRWDVDSILSSRGARTSMKQLSEVALSIIRMMPQFPISVLEQYPEQAPLRASSNCGDSDATGVSMSQVDTPDIEQVGRVPLVKPDGPIPNGFRYRGGTKSGLTSLAWKLVNYLWRVGEDGASFDDVAQHVWGDSQRDGNEAKDKFRSPQTRANEFFKDNALPFKVSSDPKPHLKRLADPE